jgi:hypothetical protein
VTALRFICILLLAATSLAGLPRAAAAGQVYADLDRDGVRDTVSVEPAHHLSVTVWLSTTRRVRMLRTTTPIISVATFDLDGDGRPDIVATDSSATLHVWRITPHGFLRTVHPRSGSAHLRSGIRRLLREDTDAVADGSLNGFGGAPSFEPLHRFPLPGASGRQPRSWSSAPLFTRQLCAPRAPRPPPAA